MEDLEGMWYLQQNKRIRNITNPRKPVIQDMATATDVTYEPLQSTRTMPSWIIKP